MRTVLFLMFSIAFLMHNSHGQTRPFSIADMNGLDSMLANGYTQEVCSILRSDSLIRAYISQHTWNADPESVKVAYLDIMENVCNGSPDPGTIRKHVALYLTRSPLRYDASNAGELAHHAYTEMKTAYDKGDSISLYVMSVVANYLRSKHVCLEELRLLGNAKRLEDLVEECRERIRDIRQQRETEFRVDAFGEANHLCEAFELENRQTPAFRTIGQELDDRYQRCRLELSALKSQEERERQAGFKSVKYTVGASVGAFYSQTETFRPYLLSTRVNGTMGPPVPVDEHANHATQSHGYLGYAIAVDGSYLWQDNLSIELELMYGRIERERPAVHPYLDYNIFIPGFSSPIHYGSITCLVNYMSRVKTGLRMFTGAGASFTMSHAPESREFAGPEPQFQFTNSPLDDRKSIRAAIRGGIEYIHSAESSISISLIVNTSLRLSGDQDESVLFIHPLIRINLLL
jgi:hypothetical protein